MKFLMLYPHKKRAVEMKNYSQLFFNNSSASFEI